MLVPEARMDEAIARRARQPPSRSPSATRTATPAIGPVVSKAQFDKIQGLIQKGIDEGATLVAGGPGRPDGLDNGYYVKPTVFANVTNDMTIAREEIFGPVLSILGYDDLDQAVEIANDTEYGLAGYVAAADLEKARAVARRIRAGQVAINGGVRHERAVRRLQEERQRPRVGRLRLPRVPGDQGHPRLRAPVGRFRRGYGR